jgi:hypothetical protein
LILLADEDGIDYQPLKTFYEVRPAESIPPKATVKRQLRFELVDPSALTHLKIDGQRLPFIRQDQATPASQPDDGER